MRKDGRRRRGPDGKRQGLIDAGIRLLSRKDYEAISMARIAREAGCSVGALYARFPEKNSYLYHLVASAYRTMADRAGTELGARPSRHMPLPVLVRHVVEHVVTTMTDARAAGVIRATMKLSTVKPITIELFEDYRATLTRLTVALLSPRIRGNSTGAIRVGMQMVLATVTDAILQPRPGPMAAGTKRMKDALTQVMLGYLGVSAGGSWAGEEADGEDKVETTPEADDADQDDRPNEADGVYDPDFRVFRKARGVAKQPPISKGKNSKTGRPRPVPRNAGPGGPPAPIAIKPAAVAKALPKPNKPKRKHRWI